MNDNIEFAITQQDQAETIAKHFNKELTSLTYHGVAELLDKIIDDIALRNKSLGK